MRGNYDFILSGVPLYSSSNCHAATPQRHVMQRPWPQQRWLSAPDCHTGVSRSLTVMLHCSQPLLSHSSSSLSRAHSRCAVLFSIAAWLLHCSHLGAMHGCYGCSGTHSGLGGCQLLPRYLTAPADQDTWSVAADAIARWATVGETQQTLQTIVVPCRSGSCCAAGIRYRTGCYTVFSAQGFFQKNLTWLGTAQQCEVEG